MSPRDQIAEKALALDPDDRAYLADLLEQSLPNEGLAIPVHAAAWTLEIERRIAAYDRGETTAINFEDALGSMQKALEERRTARGKS